MLEYERDDTPVPVPVRAEVRPVRGWLWTSVRDDRPAGSEAPAAVWFAYSPRSRYRADTFLNRCNPRLNGENLFHQNALHFGILVRAAIGDDNGAVVHVRCMA